MLPNPKSNPWVAPGGTEFGDPDWQMSNHTLHMRSSFFFGAVYGGNFCLVEYSGASIWCTGTRGRLNSMWMQRDGNLVVYDLAGKALWSSTELSRRDVGPLHCALLASSWIGDPGRLSPLDGRHRY
jgi:hypothetical protein